MKEVFSITDFDGYIDAMRKAAIASYTEQCMDNFDDFITINETRRIVEENSRGYDEENRLIITQQDHNNIFDSISVWIFNIGLSKLAGQDKIECAWCDEDNDMVFWAKSEPKEQAIYDIPKDRGN